MESFANMADEALALRYVNGDNRAFDELLSRNQQKLFTYIKIMVHDDDTANDIFQDTFVKVITRLQEGRYTDSGKFCFWLIRIAHNIIMDRFRQQKNGVMLESDADKDLSNMHSASIMDVNREEEMISQQVLCDVKKMMNALPAPQREVVYMRYFQQLSFKEIAEITGVSINTSLGRMRYALINLRRMARQYEIQLSLAI